MIENSPDKSYYEVLLTPKELSEWLQIKTATVYKWTHIGFIPHIKIGGNIRFNRIQIERWLKRKERRGRSTYCYPIDNIDVGPN